VRRTWAKGADRPALAAIAALGVVAAGLTVGASCAWLDPEVGPLRAGDASAPTPDTALDASNEPDVGDASPISFKRDLRPLIDRLPSDPTGHGCRACHYSTQASHVGLDEAALDLATLGALRRGGFSSGARIVVAGDPDASVLVQKLEGTYSIGTRMPRDGPPYWSVDEIAKVRRWIAEGALGADDE
jgi:hypothetical protein